jgi:catechol 2,3-dioxygenase-like lactoylglutathione lyase family enzyme
MEGLMLGDFPIRPVLLSKDLAATRAFYHDRLGFEIIVEMPERIEFRAGDTSFVVTRSTVGTADRQTQARIEVPDLNAALADLRARGVHIEEYELPDPPTTNGIADMGFAWAAWFIDPGGNAIAVIEIKTTAA